MRHVRERSLRGLTSAEVEERIEHGDVNVSMEIETKSVAQLIFENLFTLFNLMNAVLAVLVLFTGSLKNLSFLAVVILNTSIGVIQSIRSKRMVDRLTLLATKRVVVVRDGAEVDLDLEQIVIDDIVRLGRGDQIPADSVVVTGEAQVNESLLTGESDLIRKKPGSKLMSGSFIDSGLIYARVEHVGADNFVSKINNDAKYVKPVNSEIMSALGSIVRFASVVMIPLGVALLFSSLHGTYVHSDARALGTTMWGWLVQEISAGRVPSAELLSTAGALLGMIPQGLVLLTSTVLAFATFRLARRHVLAQQLYCIETLARVDVLCLDKTGTITSGRMEVEGTYPVPVQGGEGSAEPDVSADVSVLDFAVANIAWATSEDANETLRALLEHYGARDDIPIEEPLVVVPFSSARKWSGATLPQGSFVIGAAQFVLDSEAYAEIEHEVARLADTSRVLVAAEVARFSDDGEIIGEARPIGLVAIRDEIRSSARETVGYFNEQGVTLNVISGDDPRTASSIARVVGIPDAAAWVDATTLDTEAKLDAAADRYHVFGRVTPYQKRALVQALQRRGHTVAMTGDGVNDVLALKEADCSIAMAAGSDAARNVAEIVLVDNDFSSMPAVVAEGRRSINNLQRSASLFLTKTLFSMALAAICIAFPPYPFTIVQMTLINFFCIGFPGFVLGLESNRARVEGGFLSNVLRRALPASASVVISACLCMVAAVLFSFSDVVFSTMCLVTTSAIGTCLIWRISRPFTPLRCVLLASVVAGLLAGIVGFPDLFSIAHLAVDEEIVIALIAVAGCALYFKLARALDMRPARLTRSATGFGRGVRVRLGARGAPSKVTSTGSLARRLARRACSKLRSRGDKAAKRSAAASAAKALSRARAGEPVGSDRRAAGGCKRVVKSPQGIQVKMGHRGRDGKRRPH
ncbi:ATPase, P-type (transporting), HAD superfamily, subfamily IC [Coriobacterium glomerans PW2]|uniref:ATPase, P-type (Transporting), HAD superfamily, subfamily IC n=1 Tax=Coriobacterium glomerans (strain ATCC 49209 / DSM 20642 / JCM 10262 / PW2) TaxID=700015 RepID=F2N7S1_CORGP|nr:HAD-IC family P-type ATPase [Coriobacterium glomerans]AEB06963.1 ATPase, P-type (transporting), HAD superfamily, subfamily IC [Coriobacterium glomerans PW2]